MIIKVEPRGVHIIWGYYETPLGLMYGRVYYWTWIANTYQSCGPLSLGPENDFG